MTHPMPDSVSPQRLPAGYLIYLGYQDGIYVTVPTLRSKFPGRKIIGLTVTGGTTACDGCDIESGDLSPESGAAWAQRKLAAAPNSRPVLYASISRMPGVIDELGKLSITREQVRLLSAHYGDGQHICGPDTCRYFEKLNAGTTPAMDGTQWTDEFPGIGGPIDMSELAAGFFGRPVPPSTANWTEFDMTRLPVLRQGDSDKPGSFFHVHRAQSLVSVAGALNDLPAAKNLTGDGDFGTVTTGAVKAVQAHYRIAEDGEVGERNLGGAFDRFGVVKLALTLLLIAFGALLLILATLRAGGVIAVTGGSWLLPGGLAALAVAWFVSHLPVT